MSRVAPLLILLWDSYYGRDFVHRDYDFRDCDSKCVVSFNRSDEVNASAVLFHTVWDNRVDELPDVRTHLGQYWVWIASEAPGTPEPNRSYSGAHAPVEKLNNLFNMSMTYQQNSDIILSYGSAVPKVSPSSYFFWNVQIKSLFQRKRRLAAWTSSHCETDSRREDYVHELKKTLSVDVFGKCGGVVGVVLGAGHQNHADMIKRNYAFYLAFENRLCKDYITEKFWIDALLNYAIPVVRGGLTKNDYISVAPPHSFINVEDFSSPKELADYMAHVASNYTLFSFYHEWRMTHELTVKDIQWSASKLSEEHATCELCKYLYVLKGKQRRLNLTHFWNEGTSCRAGFSL
jgi:hypothetical protein